MTTYDTNNTVWTVSLDPAFKTQGQNMFTKGIDYASINDCHWDKIEVHDLTFDGATRFAEQIVKALNKEATP